MFPSSALQSAPRPRCSPPIKDVSSKLPSKLQQKWLREEEKNYQHVHMVYTRISKKCLWWHHVIKNSKDKKKRKSAKKNFLKFYPTMMALNYNGFDDYLPFGTTFDLDFLYYRLNTR